MTGIRRARLHVLAAALVLLAACATGPRQSPEEEAAQIAAVMTGNTLVSVGTGHGLQVEYHTADGRALLWYPGNRALVPSLWKVEAGPRPAKVCYLYPNRSCNPVTREYGGTWDCRNGRVRMRRTTFYRGDPFRLSAGRLPFVLTRDIGTLAELAARMGIDPARLRVVSAGGDAT